MRRVIFVNRYFFPDHSATSQILSDLAFHLAAAGREVHVVTSRQIYDDPKASLPHYQTFRHVRVHRVSSTRFGRTTLLGRSVDYASFYQSVWRCLTDITRRGDLIIAKTDPPLVCIVALAAAGRAGAGLVNWLQDIYPEIAVESGLPLILGPLASGFGALRNRALTDAEATVAVGELMGRKVKSLGAPPARVHVIPNWCDDEEIKPIARSENPFRAAWDLKDKFIVCYSGNLGRVHEYETVLSAAECFRSDRNIVFLMIGGGKRFNELASAVRGRALDTLFRFVPYQQRNMLPYSLGIADVHWLSLYPNLEGLVVPSKFYGIAAAGKPIVVIAAKDGELARLTQQYDCGLVVEPGDVHALVKALMRLSQEPELLKGMGLRARQMLETQFTRQKALERWRRLLEQLDDRSGANGTTGGAI